MTRRLTAALGLAAFALASTAKAETIPTLRCDGVDGGVMFLTITGNTARWEGSGVVGPVPPSSMHAEEMPVTVTPWALVIRGMRGSSSRSQATQAHGHVRRRANEVLTHARPDRARAADQHRVRAGGVPVMNAPSTHRLRVTIPIEVDQLADPFMRTSVPLVIGIEFTYTPASGDDPDEQPELELVAATLLDGAGTGPPDAQQVQALAEDWLVTDYAVARRAAERKRANR